MARLSGLELTLENWRELLVSLEEPIYRAEQIGDWIYRKKIFTFEGMTNLPRELRSKLDNAVDLRLPELVKETSSFRDGTRKFLWRLEDGATVESVFLPHSSHRTACLSSQVGCALGCSFCATGQGGFVRDMTAGEIVGHLLAMEHHVGMSVQNVVLMGMGEPLLNTTEVFKALGMIHEPGMRNMGVRHMAISTAGIVPGIDALAESGLGVRLAVSLHAAEDALRSQLMPVNQIHPLGELRQALLRYQAKTGDRVTLEYTLMEDVNDTMPHVEALVAFVQGLNVFVNLIPYNGDDGNFRCPPQDRMERFRRLLQERQVNAELRISRGEDIEGACGRLRSQQAPEEDHYPRPEGSRGDARPRSGGEGDRRFSDRPRPPRPQGSREGFRPRSGGEGERRFDDRPRPPRPEGERRFDDRPRPPRPEGERRFDDRPRPPRPEGERRFDDRPRPPRPEGARGDSRPRHPGGGGNRGPRPSRG